ncbi:MAG: Asp-tRNA(Asn)/Glu-tRNA(Gln) amidotransferase subunit GatA [Parcubacteria group bacterium]
MDTKDLTIKKARELLDKKELSPQELFDLYKKRIGEENDKINAYISVFDYESNVPSKGDDVLRDIPCIIKDNILIEGKKCTAGSKILEKYTATYDATIISKLKNVGAVFLGKGNLDEFAMGSTGENSAFGPTLNPHDMSRVAGGSSSGPAAAVASGMALYGLGSETNGSVRMPSAWCGVVGLKPTYGRVSRNGLIAFGSSLDQIGPITKTVEDSALVLNAIAGHDDMDSTSSSAKVFDYTASLGRDIKGFKFAVPREFFNEGLNEGVRKSVEEAMKQLENLGAHIQEVSMPSFDYALAAYYIIAPSEVSANLARFDGIRYGHFANKEAIELMDVYTKSRAQGFGEEAKRRIMIGTYALSSGYYDAYYLKAQKVRTLIVNDMKKILEKYDAIIGPINAIPAPKVGELDNPLAVYAADVYMTHACLAGVPSISVPCNESEKDGVKLPAGLQITGNYFEEEKIIQIAYAYEQSRK